MIVERDVPLAPHTTLEVGGPAQFYAEIDRPEQVAEALAWAADEGVPLSVIGGGSNLLVADRGVRGLVIRQRAVAITPVGDVVDVDAGTSWDHFVAWCVQQNLAGVECLSGIPGDVGAAPIQNIGAYGQELSETLVHVEAIDRRSGEAVTLTKAACQLAYRDSVFKRDAEGRYVVVRVRFRLTPNGPPKIAYAELQRAMHGVPQTLANVRDTVIARRRSKSMVLDPNDENRRSAGSFFVNPTIATAEVDDVRTRADELAPGETLPAYPAGPEHTKLSAAWMIERCGMKRGTRRGAVGISTNHSLAIVNYGGATAAELIAFAVEVKHRVHEAFGVTLQPEPRLVGFEPDELAALLATPDRDHSA